MKTALALVLLGNVALAQHGDDLSKAEFKVQKLAPGVAVLDNGEGGNIGVSYGDDGVFLIDDQFAPLHPKIKAAVATLSPKPIRFLLNTHWHGDHAGDNELMGKDGAVIVANENVWKRLSTEQHHPLGGNVVPPTAHAGLPVITFDREMTFHLNGDVAHVIHVEHAHTDGDAIVLRGKAKVVHMGDTYFSKTYPFIDASTGGTIDGYLAASERVLALVDDTAQIVPGHGPVGTKAQLAAFHDMLKTIRDAVVKMKKQKKALEQIIAAKPGAKWDAEWGTGFIKPEALVKVIYETAGQK